jgi:BirA family biotin operon repressor/biotin-[acetyl-CoA-carboxylase] ligase
MTETGDIEVGIILNLKKAQRYVTPNELSAACKVPESGIREAIGELSARGYRIDHAPGSGYRLLGTPDLIDGADIRSDLHGNFIGTEVFTFGRITSTNDVALSLARGGSPEGTLVIAEEQARGRGRLGRVWFSPPGCGLWFSLILRPKTSAEASATISLAAAAGVAESLEKAYGIKALIKWPNDVLVDGKKICGILTEAEFVGQKVKFVIVGIGINVLTARDQFPDDIVDIATSVAIETGSKVSRTGVLAHVVAAIENNYVEMTRNGFARLREKLLGRSALIGRITRVKTPEGVVEGVAVDIDTAGALLVRKDNGLTERLVAGEVIGIL